MSVDKEIDVTGLVWHRKFTFLSDSTSQITTTVPKEYIKLPLGLCTAKAVNGPVSSKISQSSSIYYFSYFCILFRLYEMEATLAGILGEQAEEIQKKVNKRITTELTKAVKDLKSLLQETGRCEVCTLKIPCVHTKTSQNDSIIEHKLPIKLNYWKIQNKEDFLPKLNINTLEKIENYREKKIESQIEELKEIKITEKQNYLNEKNQEKKRINHAAKQKLKLEQYKDEINERKKLMIMQIRENREKQRQDEIKFKKYIETQKKKIIEYYENKNKCSENFFKNSL